jgi:hypothetical protein
MILILTGSIPNIRTVASIENTHAVGILAIQRLSSACRLTASVGAPCHTFIMFFIHSHSTWIDHFLGRNQATEKYR